MARPAGPRREITLIDAIAIALGAIIGAGIFAVLGAAAGVAGAALPVAILIAALVAAANGLSAAELGANYPYAGGPYTFGYRMLAPVVGFGAGWLYLLAYLLGSTAIALTFAGYLQAMAPHLPQRAVAAALAVLGLAVNLAGVQQSRRVNDLLVGIKVLALAVVVLVGVAYLGLWDPRFFTPIVPGAIPRASALLFFAYAGFDRAVVIADEVRDPARTLPRSMVVALAASTLLYLAVAIVGQGLVGPGGLAASQAPLRTALAPTGQVWAQTVVSVGALVATADVLLTNIWGLSRVAYAMAERGDLPRALARLDRRGTPRLAVLVTGGLVVPLAATVAIGPALAAASLGQLAYYGLMDAAALRLPVPQRLYPRFVPALGLLACAGLAFALPAAALLVVGAFLAAGLLYYWLRRRRR